MKKLIKLKLNQLCNSELKKREMNTIKGGKCCVCGCRGISSDWDNGNANVAHGYEPADGMGGYGRKYVILEELKNKESLTTPLNKLLQKTIYYSERSKEFLRSYIASASKFFTFVQNYANKKHS